MVVLPDLAGKYTGTALVCGSAPCLYKDIEEAMEHVENPYVMALNDAARVIHADGIATLHPEKMRWFKQASKNPEAKGHCSAHKHSDDWADHVDYWWPDCQSGATSAFSAVKILQKMGFDQIILCGCPLSGGGYGEGMEGFDCTHEKRIGHVPPEGKLMRAHRNNLAEEVGTGQIIADKVKSMSGWTAEKFGKPAWST